MAIQITPIPRLSEMAAPALTLGTSNSAGAAKTVLATNSTILAFDATVPDAITFGQSGAAGSAVVTSRRDHAHAMAALSGVVGQVVSDSLLTVFTSSSATFTDITGLAVAITPTASTSKILVHFSIVGSQDVGVERASFRLMRDSTAISVGTAVGNRDSITGEFAQFNASVLSGPLAGVYLDSPSSTSELTYKLQVKTGGEVFINRTDDYGDTGADGNYASNIVVMEVLA